MTVGVPTCKSTTTVVDIANFLIENNVEELVVLGEEGEGIGVCGYRELVNAYERENVRELTAEDVMSEGVPELPSDITLKLAAQLMQRQRNPRGLHEPQLGRHYLSGSIHFVQAPGSSSGGRE